MSASPVPAQQRSPPQGTASSTLASQSASSATAASTATSAGSPHLPPLLSAKPHSPPQPAQRASPGLISPPLSTSGNQPPSQLANLLGQALQETEALKHELHVARRRADKAERIVALFQGAGAPVPPDDPQYTSARNDASIAKAQPPMPEAAVKAILDAEGRADRAERARDDAQNRLHTLVSHYAEFERYLSSIELRAADARTAFSRFFTSAASSSSISSPPFSLPSVPPPLSGPPLLPPMNTSAPNSATQSTFGALPHVRYAPQQRGSVLSSSQTVPSLPSAHLNVRSSVSHASSLNSSAPTSHPNSAQSPFHALPLPPPPSAVTAGTLGLGSGLTRDGQIRLDARELQSAGREREREQMQLDLVHVPSKRSHRRSRVGQEEWEDQKRRRVGYDVDMDSPMHSPGYSLSQQPSPPYSHATTRLPQAQHRSSNASAYDQRYPTNDSYARQPSSAISSGQHRPSQPTPSQYDAQQMSRHSSVHGSHRERERGRDYNRARHTGQGGRSLSQSSAGSSWSIDEMLLETATDANGAPAGRAGAGAGGDAYSGSGRRTGEGASDVHSDVPVGPHRDPPSLQQYQTHIFAPPVTGAPTKKNKIVPASQLVTLGPGGVVLSGGGQATAPPPTALPGGGYPAQNAAGQRICRQCGMPGRYKEGKCVEKWGPGPEGPGTVCDRCRKKMKRVERRGTIDQASSASILAQTQSLSNVTTQGQSQGLSAPLSTSHASPPHRTDTMIISDTRDRDRGERSQLLSPRPTMDYRDRDRERERERERDRESRAGSSRSHSPAADRSTYHDRERDRMAGASMPSSRAHHGHASHHGHGGHLHPHAQSQGHRRAPTPPYINSISTREQYQNGAPRNAGAGGGSRATSVGEDDLLSGDADGEVELDVDAEIARTLPSSAPSSRDHRDRDRDRERERERERRIEGSPGSSTASVSSALSAAPGMMSNGVKPGINGSSGRHYATSGALQTANGNGVKRMQLAPESMDVDADADADAEADPDADLLDAVDAAGRMKEEE